MVLDLDPELEEALNDQAGKQNVSVEVLVANALGERFLGHKLPFEPSEWMKELLKVAVNCGVSLSNEDLSRESLYD